MRSTDIISSEDTDWYMSHILGFGYEVRYASSGTVGDQPAGAIMNGPFVRKPSMNLGNRLRKDNLTRIIEAIWRTPRISRAQVARMLRLDRSTVGQLVDSLISHGVLLEDADGVVGPRGGRPPILLKVCPGYCYVIGIELTYPLIRLTAIDLNRQILGERDIKVGSNPLVPLDQLVHEIQSLREHIDGTCITQMGMVATGLGVSGLVDTLNGIIELSDAFSIYKPMPLATEIETRTGKPSFLFNDAQTCALGEISIRQTSNLLFVRVELRPGMKPENIGVGIGCLVEGSLLHGRSVTHLLRPLQSDIPWMEGGRLQFVDRLAHSVALMGNVLGIDHIVFGGDLSGIFPDITHSIVDYALRKDQEAGFRPFYIEESLSGPRAVSYGSCYAALDRLFSIREFPFIVEE
jgi:hypothetical protein